MNLTHISKFLSLILRHKPQVIGIHLDPHGWANVDELLEKMQQRYPVTREILEEIVRTDNKQRYSFDEKHIRIRANQGHSIRVDVELPVVVPPKYLYHGTGEKSVASIDEEGLLPMNRLYVHLSGDKETAMKVGRRHGKPVVYRLNSGDMQQQGYIFYRSVNGVWLTKKVPVVFLEKLQ